MILTSLYKPDLSSPWESSDVERIVNVLTRNAPNGHKMHLQNLIAGSRTAEDIKRKIQLHQDLLAEKKFAFTAKESKKYSFRMQRYRGPLSPYKHPKPTKTDRMTNTHKDKLIIGGGTIRSSRTIIIQK